MAQQRTRRTTESEIVDTDDAMRYVGELLRTHSIRPNIFGYTPHFKQNEFHSHGHIQTARDIIGIQEIGTKITSKSDLKKIRHYNGGNRSGKTTGGITDDLWMVEKQHPYIDVDAIWKEPIRGRIVTTDFNNGYAAIIMPEIVRWCTKSWFKGGSYDTAWNEKEHRIDFANKGFIEIRTYDQPLSKHAGTSRHFIHFDEEPPEDVYKENMARLVDTGGLASITMTPVEGETWSKEEIFDKGGNGFVLVIEVDMLDNPFVADEEKHAYISTLNKEDIEARVHGRYVHAGELMYPGFKVKIHVIQEEVPSRDYLWAASLDHGLRNPTAWLWHAVNFEGRIITFWEWYESG